MSGVARLAMALSLLTFLAACGGQNGNGGTGPVVVPPEPDPVFTIGSGSGTSFTAGVLATSTTDLAGGDSATITASLADETGALFTGAAEVSFRSDCSAIGQASINTPVNVTDGFATTVYQPQGCVGEDNITATVTVNGNTSTATTAVTVRQVAVLGSITDSGFAPGVLTIGLSSISAGGNTTITASLADNSGDAVDATASTVTFTSACVSAGLATIDSPVAVEGSAVATVYTAQGCTGDDTITATVTVDGARTTATGTVNVLPAVVGSLQFVSAVPDAIGIRGFGLKEVSRITFRVLDTSGNPVRNEEVIFSLNTSVGGISLSGSSGTSNASGDVSIDVRSGFIQTSVAVSAQLASNTSLGTQSDSLVVSTGIADQNSMSLAATDLNPEGFDFDGTISTLTVRASDHFNNPVPDGTAVAFTTEGGQIQSQCLTTDGACSVVWTSSNPRPLDGRATVLATVIGEESFTDTNGNGVLDGNDTFLDTTEAYRDDTESGTFDQGIEEFLDFNNNAMFDAEDSAYNGVLCCDASAVEGAASGDACFGRTPTSKVCSAGRNIHVRGQLVLVMAASNLDFIADKTALSGAGETTDSTLVAIYSVVSDGSLQVPPSGTAITVTASHGTLESETSVVVPSTNFNGPYTIAVIWTGDSTPSSGSIKITATTPLGLINSFSISATD